MWQDADMRYYCDQCEQGFTRKEHLQRHQTRHNAGRRFACKQCSKQFARVDVLRRHEQTHQTVVPQKATDGDVQQSSTLRRPRAAIACDRCAIAKTRCDGQLPCDQCQAKSLVCTLERPHIAVNRNRRTSTQLDSVLPANGGNITQFDLPLGTTSSETELSNNRERNILEAIQSSRNNANGFVPLSEVDNPTQGSFATHQTISTFTGLGLGSRKPQQDVTFDLMDSNMEFSWDGMDAFFQTPSPFVDRGVPPSLGRADVHFPATDLGRASFPDNTIAEGHKSPDGSFSSSIHPFDNDPFGYRFKQGPTVNARQICEVLHDRAAWDEAIVVNATHVAAKLPFPAINEAIRDAIAGRVNGMLQRLLDRSNFTKVPHTFPSRETIQSLFAAYQRAFAAMYPIVHPTTFHESSWDRDNPYADVGLFLTALINLGGLVSGVEKVRGFSVELGYLIRVIINEDVGQDESRLTDQWVAGSGVMMTLHSAWSGIKRHMELAEAFHAIFSSFFLRRGYYEAHPQYSMDEHQRAYGSWTSWIQRERALRLCQVWYIIEHEISLFYTVQPSISFNKIRCPMPVSDELFLQSDEENWRAMVDEWSANGQSTTKLHPPSLATFRSLFLRDDFLHLELNVTPLQARLLLCTIQAQVTAFSQANRFVSPETRFAPSKCFDHGQNDLIRLRQQEEFENMLVKWNILAERVFKQASSSELKISCLLIAQLVCLELYICFDDVQLITGKEGYNTGKSYLPYVQQWSQSVAARKALAHAGNILKILQTDDTNPRPVWWPVAVSRTALVLWCYNTGVYLSTDTIAGVDDATLRRTQLISLNDPNRVFEPCGRIIQPGEGIPCMQDHKGALVAVYDAPALFDLCLQILDQPTIVSTPLLAGIRLFLQDVKSHGNPYISGQDKPDGNRPGI